MKQNKLPLSLLHDKVQSARVHILDTEGFETTFGPKAQRKRPSLNASDMLVFFGILVFFWYFDSDGLLLSFYLPTRFWLQIIIICFMLLYVFLVAAMSRNFFVVAEFHGSSPNIFWWENYQAVSLNINLNENPMPTRVLSFSRVFLSIYDNRKWLPYQ